MGQISKMQEQIMKHFLKNTINHKSETQDSDWITLQEPSIIKLILETFADEDKKMILDSVLYESKNILEILEITKVPKTSGYRKINSLIDDGMLIVQDSHNVRDMKNGKKYKSIFENVIINIYKNNVIIKILITNDALEKFTTIKVAQS